MLRDVVEDFHFSEEFDSLRAAYPEIDMDAVHASITWTLAADPRVGDRIANYPDPTTRLYPTTPINDAPIFMVAVAIHG